MQPTIPFLSGFGPVPFLILLYKKIEVYIMFTEYYSNINQNTSKFLLLFYYINVPAGIDNVVKY